MKPYNVEIFDSDIAYRDHTELDAVSLSIDCLDIEKNKIDLPLGTEVQERDFIRIKRDDEEYLGIVTQVDLKDDEVRVSFVDMMNIFDIPVMVSMSDIGSGTMEQFIADCITDALISSSDTYQNLDYLAVSVGSSTTGWSLSTSSEADMIELDLFDDIILPAMQAYQIRVTFEADLNDQTITATIDKNTSTEVTIEADLPNVIEKTVTVKKPKKDINKVVVYNKNDYSMIRTYYLHSDDSYDTTDDDRREPVNYSIETVSSSNQEKALASIEKEMQSAATEIKSLNSQETLSDDDKAQLLADAEILNSRLSLGLTADSDGYITDSSGTIVTDLSTIEDEITEYVSSSAGETEADEVALADFIEDADTKAATVFSRNSYENLIKIKVLTSDTLVNPEDMEIGQVVSVIHNSTEYSTVLTGKNIEEDTTELVFGMIRTELTKLLKGRY